MANRRMFLLDVVDTDAFLDLPISEYVATSCNGSSARLHFKSNL